MTKKKSNAGRPTVMTESVLRKLEEAFSNGATDEQACFYAGITKTPFYVYQDAHPEFKERKEALKSHLQLIAKNTIAKAIKTGDVKQASWLLERKEPETYGQTQKHIGDPEKPIIAKIEVQLVNTQDKDS